MSQRLNAGFSWYAPDLAVAAVDKASQCRHIALRFSLFPAPRFVTSCVCGVVQPVSITADAVRGCMLGGVATSTVVAAVLWSLGLSAVLAPLAVRRFRNT